MTLELQLSHVLHEQLLKNAGAANITVEEFLLLAAAEKIAAMEHHRWLTGDAATNPMDPCGQ